MKGLHAEVRAKFHRSVENYIKVSRVLQGQDDLRYANQQEQDDIIVRFNSVMADAKTSASWRSKEKQPVPPSSSTGRQGEAPQIVEPESLELGDEPPKTGFWNTRHLPIEERRKLRAMKDAWKLKKRAEAAGIAMSLGAGAGSGSRTGSSTSLGQAGPTGSSPTPEHDGEDEEMERAIRASVAQTSRGDGAEDARIEAQIRASVREMRRIAEENRRQAQDEQQGLGPIEMRDWKENRGPSDLPPRMGDEKKGRQGAKIGEDITDEEFETLIAEAVRESLEAAAAQQSGVKGMMAGGEEEGREDEALRLALEESRRAGAGAGEDEEELKRALEESERAHRERVARESTERSEEEIILEYVKKQSLAEEEFRRRQQQQKDSGEGGVVGGGGEEEDEDLRRALEESLRVSGRQGGPSR